MFSMESRRGDAVGYSRTEANGGVATTMPLLASVPKETVPTRSAPTPPTITDVPSDPSIFFSPPANQRDFKNPFTYKLWDWNMRLYFWYGIWYTESGNFCTTEPPVGIAYRLPDARLLGNSTYENYLTSKSYLQFRPTSHLYEMAKKSSGGSGQPAEAEITWTGFPKGLQGAPNKYEEAEKLGFRNVPLARRQDEYCEWFTHRDEDGKLKRLDITCEAPEYWEFMFQTERDTVVELYQKHISPDVKADDLMDRRGFYDRYNVWNTTRGAMHLNCPPNSLLAEIYIAAESALQWGNCPDPDADAAECSRLIDCGQYGAPGRASDPTIGEQVNALVRGGNIVSIQNPVGLYMKDLNTDGWMNNKREAFSKEELEQIVTYERGERGPKQHNVRIRVEIPESWGYTLGDCFIAGAPIRWAGQVIESSVTVFLTGIAVDGSDFLSDRPEANAVVPCKDKWDYSFAGVVGPVPRCNPLYPQPERPVEGVSDEMREAHLSGGST